MAANKIITTIKPSVTSPPLLLLAVIVVMGGTCTTTLFIEDELPDEVSLSSFDVAVALLETEGAAALTVRELSATFTADAILLVILVMKLVLVISDFMLAAAADVAAFTSYSIFSLVADNLRRRAATSVIDKILISAGFLSHAAANASRSLSLLSLA